MYPFEPSRPDQMQLDRNELVYVIEESDPPGWIKARKKYDGVEGWVPKTYVRECVSETLVTMDTCNLLRQII